MTLHYVIWHRIARNDMAWHVLTRHYISIHYIAILHLKFTWTSTELQRNFKWTSLNLTEPHCIAPNYLWWTRRDYFVRPVALVTINGSVRWLQWQVLKQMEWLLSFTVPVILQATACLWPTCIQDLHLRPTRHVWHAYFTYMPTYTHTLHDLALHCLTSHCISSHYITLHHITIHYTVGVPWLWGGSPPPQQRSYD
jgi:hypothetical protein